MAEPSRELHQAELASRVEELLDDGHATCMAFNRWGDMLAAGDKTGIITLWDFKTRLVAQSCEAHTNSVTAVTFTYDGTKLLSACERKELVLWDVLPNKEIYRLTLTKPAISLQASRGGSVNPQGGVAIVSFAVGCPVVVRVATRDHRTLLAPASAPEKVGYGTQLTEAVWHAVYGKDDALCYAVNSLGFLYVVNSDREVLEVLKVPAQAVPRLTVSAEGSRLGFVAENGTIANLRIFSLEGPKKRRLAQVLECLAASKVDQAKPFASLLTSLQHHKPLLVLEDSTAPIPRPDPPGAWALAVSSPLRDFVAQGLTTSHAVVVVDWKANTHAVVEAAVEGGVLALAWHPKRPWLVSLSKEGKLVLWTENRAQQWSRFAPDFLELDYNKEYGEQEDEFDLNPREEDEEMPMANGNGVCKAEPLDIFTRSAKQIEEAEYGEEGKPLRLLRARIEKEPHVEEPREEPPTTSTALPGGPPVADSGDGVPPVPPLGVPPEVPRGGQAPLPKPPPPRLTVKMPGSKGRGGEAPRREGPEDMEIDDAAASLSYQLKSKGVLAAQPQHIQQPPSIPCHDPPPSSSGLYTERGQQQQGSQQSFSLQGRDSFSSRQQPTAGPGPSRLPAGTTFASESGGSSRTTPWIPRPSGEQEGGLERQWDNMQQRSIHQGPGSLGGSSEGSGLPPYGVASAEREEPPRVSNPGLYGMLPQLPQYNSVEGLQYPSTSMQQGEPRSQPSNNPGKGGDVAGSLSQRVGQSLLRGAGGFVGPSSEDLARRRQAQVALENVEQNGSDLVWTD